jgi:hypothetical protein
VIKGRASKPDGTPVLILGLTGENVTRITADEPLRVDPAEMDAMGLPPVEVVIMYGRTEQAIVDKLRAAGLMPPGTPLVNPCADPNCTQDHAR